MVSPGRVSQSTDDGVRIATSFLSVYMSAWGPRTAVQVILAEHEQLTTVIGGMLRFVDMRDPGGKPPGLMVFRTMLYYIREYPEKVHHPEEDRYLFTRLSARTDELDETIEELELQLPTVTSGLKIWRMSGPAMI